MTLFQKNLKEKRKIEGHNHREGVFRENIYHENFMVKNFMKIQNNDKTALLVKSTFTNFLSYSTP